MTRGLLDYEALSFDCYGTLIDWESGIWDALQPLLWANDRPIGRADVLAEFARLETRQQQETPRLRYPELLAKVHHDLAGALGLASTEALDSAFGASVPKWPAFTDSAGSLSYLGSRYRLVILSNVDRDSFAASNRLLQVAFDAVYTAEDVGSYKPDPANFDYLLRHLDLDLAISPDAVLHVAQSLFHDHAPAKAAGLDTVWIDRQRLSAGGEWGATVPVEEPPVPNHVFFSMADLARAVQVS
ncbi:MAG TPA: haloacid dehalogenase type II [Acidimicrobiia bacterium]|nr:haloacid dehalogenase type II [Acidimicrobiia bacterium]